MIDYEELSRMKLFAGIEPGELASLLGCVSARQATYAKDEFIIEEGDHVAEFGVVLAGRGRSVKWDASGRMVIITLLEKGGVFGVLLAARQEQKSSVFIQALDELSVLLLPYDELVARCERNCQKHERLLRNYISAMADKGLELHERISCLLRPTIRDKIITYLRQISRERQSRIFEIPLNRNTMAEYLNVERSALSRELSAMKRDSIIDYHRNSFKLLGIPGEIQNH
jgi:CRP-like cAMP-binding protein